MWRLLLSPNRCRRERHVSKGKLAVHRRNCNYPNFPPIWISLYYLWHNMLPGFCMSLNGGHFSTTGQGATLDCGTLAGATKEVAWTCVISKMCIWIPGNLKWQFPSNGKKNNLGKPLSFQEGPFGDVLMTRHSANCLFSMVEEAAIPYTGYLPQVTVTGLSS